MARRCAKRWWTLRSRKAARCWCASRAAASAIPTCTCRTAISCSATASSSTCAAAARCRSRSATRSPARSRAPGPDAGMAPGSQGRGLSLDRLRPMRGLQGRRREHLRGAAPSRHHRRRRLRHPRADPASALSDRLRAAVAVLRRRADVLGAHRLRRAQARSPTAPRARRCCWSASAASG